MKSKHRIDEYKEWINDLYGNIGFNLVFYTNKEYAPYIKEIRKNFKDNTKVIVLEFEDFESLKKYPMSFWKEQNEIDHEEYHTPEMYCVWYEKKEFVKKTIENNPFNSEYFIWVDAGICREKEWIALLKDFPIINKIPDNTIMINKIKDFSDKDKNFNFQHEPENIGAGIIAGKKEIWNKYDKLYDNVILQYIYDGRFAGKEQNIMSTMILTEPKLFSLFDGDAVSNDNYNYSKWHALLFYLAS